MPVELTDEEANAARRALQLVAQLNGNPEARRYLENGLKVLNPEVTTSDDVIANIRKPLEEEIAALKKQREDDIAAKAASDKEAAEALALKRMEESFNRLRTNEGLQPEGETKVREIMQSRGIYDPEAAFALFEKQNPRPVSEQASWTPQSWSVEDHVGPSAEDWFKNPDKAQDEAIAAVLTEMRRGDA